jgi:hypothetical protein
MAVENLFSLGVIGNASIDNHILPLAILEELEHREPMLDAVMHDQILQQVRVGAQDQERAKEPTVTQYSLLNISRREGIFLHYRLTIGDNLLWSLPFNRGHVDGVLRGVHGVIVERGVLGCELLVTKESIVFLANLDQLHDLLLDWVLLLFLLIRVASIHHVIGVLAILDIFLLGQHLLVLLLSQGLAVLANILALVVLALHHLERVREMKLTNCCW